MNALNDFETYGVLRCLYAAAVGMHPGDVDPDDANYQDMGEVLAERDAFDIAEMSKLLGLPPDEERGGEQIARAIAELQDEVRRGRNAGLRVGHRAVGGVVHHLDGNPGNNDPGNLVLVDPADRSAP